MRDKRADIELAGEDNFRNFALEGEIGRVAADQIPLMDTNG